MLIKTIFIFLINVLVCNAFYYPQPYPMPYPPQPYPMPYSPYGMMPDPYMPNPYQGPSIGTPEFIDLPASAEITDEIFVTEEIKPEFTENNETKKSIENNENKTFQPHLGIAPPPTNKPIENNENKTSISTIAKIESKIEKADIPYPTKNDPSYGTIPYPGMPYPGMPNPGMPNPGMPYGGMPYGGMPYGGMPYGGMPYGGMPYGGMPFGGLPYGGMPYNGMPYSGVPPMPPQTPPNSQTRKPLLDPEQPPYAYSPTGIIKPNFKVVKQETGESIRDVVRGPVKSSTLTVSEPSKTVITRTIDPKTGEAAVLVSSNSKDNKENNDVHSLGAATKNIPEVSRITTKKPPTFRARSK